MAVASIDLSGITTAGATYQIPITWDVSVTDFMEDDITVIGAVKGMLMGSGTTYSLAITVYNSLTDVNIQLNIADDAVTQGNPYASATATATANITTPTGLNSYVFSLPYNYDKRVIDGSMNTVTQVTDNNRLTAWSSTAATPTLVFTLGTTAVPVDSLYIVGQNISQFTMTITNGSDVDTLMTGTTNESDGRLQYALYTDLTTLTGTTATLTITPQNTSNAVRIYDVKVMRQLWHFPDNSFSVMDFNGEKRGSIIQEALDFSRSRTEPLLNYKKDTIALEVSVMSIADSNDFDRLTDDITNFVYAHEYPRFPKKVFVAHQRDDIASTYPSRWTSVGMRHTFVIEEQ